MKQLDVYYRALLKYRELTQQNRECLSDSKSVAAANTDSDKIILTRKHCIVEEDWVDAIEEGLKYIAKAIAEERQFIRSNGEVVPIEKVKNVSKDSVVHLAKHSNLITRETPGEDVIPDQLYTVEKLNDYAVYENRFLYMLLCYLRDFITMRYNKILELSNTYHGTMTMNKTVKTAKRVLKYNVDFSEEKRDDDYLKETNQAKDIINRIDLLLKTVIAFFSTPLMEFVAKAPMLKPPITKTNVLKMNNNFKQALNLYGFVVAYQGDGYRVETEIKEISPFTEVIAEEMSETILLSSFITYEHSLGIESRLKRAYELEEKRLKDEEYQKFLEKLEAARIRVQKSEMSMEEYILMLEKYIRSLEKKMKDFDKLKAELIETKNLLDEATEENRNLKQTLENTINELEAEKQRYIDDMAALKAAHEEEINNLNEEHERNVAEINENHANEIIALNQEHENHIAAINDAHENHIAEINETHQNEINELNQSHQNEIEEINQSHKTELEVKTQEITALNDKIELQKTEYSENIKNIKSEAEKNATLLKSANAEMAARLEEEIKQKRYLKAQLLALKREVGRLTREDDHITQLKFDELEHTFKTFKAYYKAEWAKAKRAIREEVLKKKKKAEAENNAAPPSPQRQVNVMPKKSVPANKTSETGTQNGNVPPSVNQNNQDKNNSGVDR